MSAVECSESPYPATNAPTTHSTKPSIRVTRDKLELTGWCAYLSVKRIQNFHPSSSASLQGPWNSEIRQKRILRNRLSQQDLNSEVCRIMPHDEGINEGYNERIYEKYEENIKQHINSSNRNQPPFHRLRDRRIGPHQPGKRHSQRGSALRCDPVAATALTQAQANWEFPNGNAFDQDYNPQNQINSSNVQYLGLSLDLPVAHRADVAELTGHGFSGPASAWR